MKPNLEDFRGQTAKQITKTLLAKGYQAVSSPHPSSRFFRDPQSDHLVRLSETPRLTAAFCAACQASNDNNFLPKIFSHATLGPTLHVSVSENLHRLEEIGAQPNITLFGHARAVSSFLAGDEMHKDVHRCMLFEQPIIDAAQTLIAVALKDCHAASAASEPAFTLDPCGDSIWFRSGEGNCQTIYADPFMASPKDPAETLKELQWMERRFSSQERDAEKSAFWRDRQP